MKKAALSVVLLVLAIFLLGAWPAAAALYKYKDLDLAFYTGNYDSYACGINASGQVAGWARTSPTGAARGFFTLAASITSCPLSPLLIIPAVM